MSPLNTARPLSSYQAAEAFLMSLVNYEMLPPPMSTDEEGWHLREFRRMLDAMGNPERHFPIIHIAGTKGKGSTTRLLSLLLAAQGWRRVGSFTSPHIEWFRERIAIDGKPISERDFTEALRAVRPFLPRQECEGFRTTFETLTAMAFHVFRQKRCEAVVLETGLGGRLDCTNAAVARVALLTAIGYDHQRVLGKTLGAIAREKAGIIKPGTGFVLVGPQGAGRRAIVRRAAVEQAARAGVPIKIHDPAHDPIRSARSEAHGFDLDIAMGNGIFLDGVRFPLLGRHQLNNLRGALMALEIFARIEKRTLRADAIRRGIEHCVIPGRMELLRERPPVLLDTAHCPMSARAAVAACVEHFPERPVILVVGVLRDKKHAHILKELAALPDVLSVVTYTPPTPRACSGNALAEEAGEFFKGSKPGLAVKSRASVEEALETALHFQRRNPRAVLLSTGTFYSIARARRFLTGR